MLIEIESGKSGGCMSRKSFRVTNRNKQAAEPLFCNYSVNDMYARSGMAVRGNKKLDSAPHKVLIGGAGSYIGIKAGQYLQDHISCKVHELDMVNLVPEPSCFSGYDTVLYVAGIAHRMERRKNAHLFFEVNYNLTVKAAKAAREASVKHFILLSSMSVYGMQEGHITKDTKTHPQNYYGKSKLAADEEIWKLRSRNFRVAILRPPAVYGKGCKGNYRLLRRAALLLPVFPDTGSRRSMIYIGNLCAFVADVICCQSEGVFFPQNAEYVNISEMVKQIAAFHGKNVRILHEWGWIKHLPFRIVRKVFGSLTYEQADNVSRYGFAESVIKTEGRIME